MIDGGHQYNLIQITRMCTEPIMSNENVLVSSQWRAARVMRGGATNCTADTRVGKKKIDVVCPVNVAAVAIR